MTDQPHADSEESNTQAGLEPLYDLDVEQLAFGMFMSLQPRTRRQWEELPDAIRDHWRRRADAALYHARTSAPTKPTANPEKLL